MSYTDSEMIISSSPTGYTVKYKVMNKNFSVLSTATEIIYYRIPGDDENPPD
jgi:hypothetical protein